MLGALGGDDEAKVPRRDWLLLDRVLQFGVVGTPSLVASN